MSPATVAALGVGELVDDRERDMLDRLDHELGDAFSPANLEVLVNHGAGSNPTWS